MVFDKNGSLTLEKDEVACLMEMAHNMLNVADLNELKSKGFVTICDTFIISEIELLLALARPKRGV